MDYLSKYEYVKITSSIHKLTFFITNISVAFYGRITSNLAKLPKFYFQGYLDIEEHTSETE